MGDNRSFHEPGQEPPVNGHDNLYGSYHWSDYIITKRPQNVLAKRAIVFLSVDVVALFIVCGIIKNLSNAKEVIALIVAIWWLGARAIIVTVKIVSFWGKNSDSIKKGIRSLKQLFKE